MYMIKKQKIMAKKQLIRLTESDLHNIIKESVNRVLMERDENLKWEKLFNLWDEWHDVGAVCFINNDDKVLIKNKVENDEELMNYFNSNEYGKIIKLIGDTIERIGSMSKVHRKIQDYLDKEREYQDDTLF